MGFDVIKVTTKTLMFDAIEKSQVEIEYRETLPKSGQNPLYSYTQG